MNPALPIKAKVPLEELGKSNSLLKKCSKKGRAG